MKRMRALWILAIGAFLPFSSYGAKYEIDKTHSSVSFRVRHLVSKVRGTFDKFDGSFEYEDGKPDKWKTDASVDTTSINTNVAKRDEHLRAKDFFDVDNKDHPDYKWIKFVSTKVTDVKDGRGKLHGNLTLKGVTKPVVFDLEIGGAATDPWGNKKAGFTATTTINRKDYGLSWNQALETGGLLVGEDVEIALEIEGQLKK